ncbi:hypothetical protein D3C76_1713000 [compost metagenome]
MFNPLEVSQRRSKHRWIGSSGHSDRYCCQCIPHIESSWDSDFFHINNDVMVALTVCIDHLALHIILFPIHVWRISIDPCFKRLCQ